MLSKPKSFYPTVNVLVFKTNATPDIDEKLITSIFRNEEGLKNWSFDFEDCDNIFRVESVGITAEEVAQKLATIDIIAEELGD